MARKWLPWMPKPRWDARNQSEKEAMRDWVFYQIEEALRARRNELLSATTDLRDLIEQEALEEAESGDVTKLRRLAKPEWCPHINPRPLKRGEKYPRRPKYSSSEHYDYSSKMRMARLAVPLIREVWREHYGKARRRPEDGFDAHEIAAAYFKVGITDVTKKPSGRRKKIRAK